MDSEHGTEATQKENDAKIKLEDLIDQVCWTLCFCHLLNFEFQFFLWLNFLRFVLLIEVCIPTFCRTRLTQPG